MVGGGNPPPLPIALVSIYEWVDLNVHAFFSHYQSDASLTELRTQIKLSNQESEHKFMLSRCSDFDCICFKAAEDEFAFIFLYKTLFKDLKIQLPFSLFQCKVLSTLNVAPSLLHPKS